jgi:hypothetical protein
MFRNRAHRLLLATAAMATAVTVVTAIGVTASGATTGTVTGARARALAASRPEVIRRRA